MTLKFETAYAETRNGYVWRVRRGGVLMCISAATYETQAEAYEHGQDAMFLYFVAEERRLARKGGE